MGIFELLQSVSVHNAETNVVGSPAIAEIRFIEKPKFILNITFNSAGEVILFKILRRLLDLILK